MSGSLIYTARTNRLLSPNSTPQVESTNNINQPTARVIQPYEHPLQTVLNATQNMTSTQDKTTFFNDNSNGIVEMPALNVSTTLWQQFGGDIQNVQGLKSNPDNDGFQYYGRSVALSDDARFLAISAWNTPEISNNVVDIYQYSDISNIWEQFQRIYNNTSPDTYHGYYITFNTLSDNTIRLFIGDDSGTNTNNVSTGTVTMYELNSSNFYEMKARQFGDEDGEFAALVDQKQDSYIVVAGPTNDTSNKIRKISIYTPDFLTRVLTIIVPTSFGVYSPADIQIDQSSNYIYFTQYSPGSTSTETQDLYIYNIKNYREDPNIQEITLTEEANLAKQFTSIPNETNNSVSSTLTISLSVSNNGEYIVVGRTWLQANIYHLDKTTDTIRLVYQIYPLKDRGFEGEFAENISMSGDGKRIAILYNGTIPYTGGVIIYETQDYLEWHQIGNQIVGDDFNDGFLSRSLNNQISLSADGRVVAIGYPFAETPETRINAGYARTYKLTDNTSILRADRNGVSFNGPLELDVLHVKDAVKFTNYNNIHMGYLAGDAAKSGYNNIRLGRNAGHHAESQSNCIAIGTRAGYSEQSALSVAIGNEAGKSAQGEQSVAIGNDAGQTTQGQRSVAIGNEAGNSQQSALSVAIGNGAGYSQQSALSVAIGNGAGETGQGEQSVAIGNEAGNSQQSASSVAIGIGAGKSAQGEQSVAIGNEAGNTGQQEHSVAIGNDAGQTEQGQRSVAIGNDAGETEQQEYSVAIGNQAGETRQGERSVAIGNDAGQTRQGQRSVAIGNQAGESEQGEYSVAIGNDAGESEQGEHSVAIGHGAATNNQGELSIALGRGAGEFSQQNQSISIGYQAGHYNQGPNSIAIGTQSGFHTDYGVDNIMIGNKSGYNENPTLLNKCVYIGNYIDSKSDTQNEIILGNDITTGLPGRGTNVMILGNDALQRIIIPSYQNLKSITPEYEGQLYIDSNNNLKVYEFPKNLAIQVFPLIYGVQNSYGNENTYTTFNQDGAAIMTMPIGARMSWNELGEENIFAEYLLNENPTHNAYQINVNIQDINVENTATDVIVFVKSFNDKLQQGIQLIEMQELPLQNGDNNDIILESQLLSNNNVAYEQVGIMLRASETQTVSVQVNTGSISLINQ